MRNGFDDIGKDPTILTRYGNPDYFIGKVNTPENLAETVLQLNAFQSSLNSSGISMSGQGFSNSTMADRSNINMSSNNMNPIVTEGGEIKYEKHSHKK